MAKTVRVLSPQRLGFEVTPVHVGSAVYEWHGERLFSRYFCLP